jgi:endonuclease I
MRSPRTVATATSTRTTGGRARTTPRVPGQRRRRVPLGAEPDPRLGPFEAGAARGLAAARQAERRPYVDPEADRAARDAYYAGVDLELTGPELLRTLTGLVTGTHQEELEYRPAEYLYPWVDLHPDLRLHHLYSGRPAEVDEVIHEDLRIGRRRAARLHDEVAADAALGPREVEAVFDRLEAELPFNCEHVVPQSWFGKRQPMRGDLHHLFACEPRCNSHRGSVPYADHADPRPTIEECGRLEDDGFEPGQDKGVVARATLYFLLRYPDLVGDELREMQAGVLPVLARWHADEPPGEYEAHRNAAVFELQGNRNPLIDFPELVDRVSWGDALGGS